MKKKTFYSIIMVMGLLSIFSRTSIGKDAIKSVKDTFTTKLEDVTSAVPTPTSKDEGNEETIATTPVTNDDGMSVYFLDVGQADSILLVNGDKSVLVDAGNRPDGDTIIEDLHAYGVEHLSAMILTHPHEDHIGSAAQILADVGTDAIYCMEENYDSTKTATGVMQAIDAEGLTPIVPSPGDVITIGDMNFNVLGPTEFDSENKNNNSIVTMVTYGGFKLLLTGDAEREEENDIIDTGANLKCNVLKAGHHGSNTSSSYVWLRQAMPDDIVICVGKDNDYGHPGKDTMSRFRDLGAEVYRTDEMGTVELHTDGSSYTINGIERTIEDVQNDSNLGEMTELN